MSDDIVTHSDKNYKLRMFLFRWGVSLPGLVAQVVFGWLPLIIGILVSFQEFHMEKSQWNGLDNYKAVLSDPNSAPFSIKMAKSFYSGEVKNYQEENGVAPSPPVKIIYGIESIYNGMGVIWRNTLFYVFLSLGLTFLVPVIVSILLTEMSPGLIRIMMILWFIPVSGMSSLIILKYFYNVDYGLLNGIIAQVYDLLGRPEAERIYPRWLNSPNLVMFCLVLPGLVMFSPGLIYITALQGIPQDLYDAAEIDGCGFVQKIWHITLPRLRPIIVTMFMLAVLHSFQVMNEVLIMTQGGPGDRTLVVGYYIYKMTFDYLEIGKGNALAVIYFCFLMFLTILQRVYIKEDKDKGEDKKTLKLIKEGN
ncbi:MAG: sugar ABC transporter permease [Fibrobacteres bacterium]|nr:sugar ABC transporter permease [Fibrobacterota bacterium]